MNFAPAKVLYFVDGMVPTVEDIAAGSDLKAHVCYRNARAVPADGALEACDGVAGCVPPRYAEAYPTAEKAIEKRAAEIKKLSAGDVPAPKAPAKAQAKPTPAAPQVDPAKPADAPQDGQQAGDGADAQAPGGKPAAGAWAAN